MVRDTTRPLIGRAQGLSNDLLKRTIETF
jgi:hypothetical protein